MDGGRVVSGDEVESGGLSGLVLVKSPQVGAQIWRTDQHGTITITFNGQGPLVASDR
jgi:hypothetical protein